MKKISATVLLISLLFSLLFSFSVQADDFKKAADKLCKKMTMCIVEQIGAEEDLPPQMKAMADNLAKTVCASLYDMKSLTLEGDHKDAAVACFVSAAAKNCDSLQDGLNTPECEKFEKMTDAISK